MRFNPKADLDTGRVSDGGGSGGGLPIPQTRAGGGAAGLIIMVLVYVVRAFIRSRRRTV